jgi:hypothetical protein
MGEQDDEVVEAKPKKLVKKVVEEDDIKPEPAKKSTLHSNKTIEVKGKPTLRSKIVKSTYISDD